MNRTAGEMVGDMMAKTIDWSLANWKAIALVGWGLYLTYELTALVSYAGVFAERFWEVTAWFKHWIQHRGTLT